MTERHFEAELRELKHQLVAMGGYVEKSIQIAIEALVSSDVTKLKLVFELEEKINHLHINIDAGCLKLLALQQPLAGDLRLVFAVIKINTDLERMGDQAVNIAENTEWFLKSLPIKLTPNLLEISTRVQAMVKESLDSFVVGSESKARAVILKDDEVDLLKTRILQESVLHIKSVPSEVEPCLNLILIARNLERIGDHATNIAEDVVFACTGLDIRHHHINEASKVKTK